MTVLKKRPFFSNCKRLGIRFHLKMNILFPFSKEKKLSSARQDVLNSLRIFDTHPFMSGTSP